MQNNLTRWAQHAAIAVLMFGAVGIPSATAAERSKTPVGPAVVCPAPAKEVALTPEATVTSKVAAMEQNNGSKYYGKMGERTVQRQLTERWVIGQARILSATDENELPTR